MLWWEELRVGGRLPAAFWVCVGLKLTLVLLLLLPLFAPDLEQYEGKGMSWRILVFPIACLIIPVLWHFTGRQKPYPYLADNLLVLPPITDVLWNTLDAYDSVYGWDKANHLVNSMVFAAVIGLWAGRHPLAAAVRFLLALGACMTLQVVWELVEYASYAGGWSEIQTYEDTIGDLALDLIGSFFGATFALIAVRGEEPTRESEPAAAFAGE